MQNDNLTAPDTVESSFLDDDDVASYQLPIQTNPSIAHSGLNVHKCTSATCDECERKDRIQFINTGANLQSRHRSEFFDEEI